MTGVIDKLVVYPERMKENLEKGGGIVHSQRVMLALTQAGVSREDAYRLVQKNAMTAWQGGGDFLVLLKADAEVTKALSVERIEACFDLGYHMKAVDEIFRRVIS
jgi:adenylosuccinate lyase